MKQAALPAALLAGLALVGCQQADSPAEHTRDSEASSQTGDMYEGTYLGGAKRFDVASQNTGIEYSVWVQTPPKYKDKGEGVEISDFPGAVENSILFLESLKQTDPDYVQSLLTWNFEPEQHGSVAAAFIASGIHHHWGTGLSYSEAAKLRNNDEWK